MKLIRGLHNLKTHHKNFVVTIGNFDGVHLGHRKLLNTLKQRSEKMNSPSMVISFEPYPMEFFLQKKAQPRLTRLSEKIPLLREAGIDYLLCIPFNQKFSEIAAETFIEEILIKKLNIKFMLIGDDFRFGHHRKGNFSMLQQYHNEFDIEEMPEFDIKEERISSTLIRKLLQHGNLQKAEKCLGRPYTMSGRVAHGDKLGRTLGFPTVNLHLHRKVVPIQGVYVVKVHGLEEKPLEGVANVGNRPAVGGTKCLLEVYIFDFDKIVYGKHIKVEFLLKLRNEENYDTLEALKKQIQIDAKNAKAYFTNK